MLTRIRVHRCMCKVTLFLLLLLFVQSALAQYVLETPDGKKVKLNANGTWTYIASKDVNPKVVFVPKTDTGKYVSKHRKFAISYDPSQWTYDTTEIKNQLSWDAVFHSTDFAITGYCLDSRLSMPTEGLEESMRSQWQNLGEITSFVLFNDTLNNTPLAAFDMLLLYRGVTYKYRGYVYSSPKGSFQFIIGTQKEVFEEDKSKIVDLFKGITKLQ